MSPARDPQAATQDAGAALSAPAALAPEEYRGLFNSIDEGFCVIEMIFDADGAAVDYRFLETNGAFEEQTGLHGATGKRMRDLEPFHEDHWFEIYGAVASTGQPRRFTEVAKHLGNRWFDCYAFPVGGPGDQRVAVLFRDITERQRDEEAARVAAERDRFRAVLAEAVRPLTDPVEIQSEVSRVLGEYLGASRVFYFEVEPDGDHISLDWDYTAVGVASIAGRYRISDFGSFVRDGFNVGRTLAVADGPSDDRLTKSERSACAALNLHGWMGVPLVKNGRLVAALGIHQTEPRSWTADEVALVEEVAERTWAVVEQARAEDARRAGEERVRLALDSAGMGSFVWYPQEDRSEPDRRMLALFGLPENGTLNLEEALATLIHPADGTPYAEAVARAVDPAGSGELHEQIRVIHPSGAQRWLAISGQTYFEGEPRRAIRMAGTGIDITDGKRTEEAVRQAAERDRFRAALGDALRPLANPIEIEYVASRLLGEHLSVNRVSYGEIVGTDLVVRASYAQGVAPLPERFPYAAFGERLFDLAGTTAVVDDVALDSRLGDAERAAYRAAEVAALIRVLLVKDNRLVASLGVHSRAPRRWTADEVALAEETAERTWAALERARAEQALRESEEQYRTLFNSMDQGFCVVEVLLDDVGAPVDYRFLEANPVFEQQTGLRDALGRTARELVPDLEERWFETYGQVALTGEPTRFVQSSQAMGRWFDVYAFRVGERESRQVAILFSDITEQKRIDSELRASEERFRSMANASPTIIWTADPTGAITFHNQRWLDFTGITAEQNVDDWPKLVLHPDDVERCMAAWTYSLETGTNYEIEVRNRRFDGEYRWFLTRATPERDSAGRIIQWLGSSTDIHDRKQIEERLRDREAAERRARQRAELMAAVIGELEVVEGVRRRAERLTELLVPRVADYASVELPDAEPVTLGNGPATVTLPLVIGARSPGVLSLGLSNPARRPYSAEDRGFLQEIAERAGLLLGNARLQEEEHHIALRLQRALLPNRVLQSPDVAIAARYQAGSDGLEVGGDWYDSFLLPDGRIGLVVGDVVGHGLDAAAAMGRLRTALVAIAGRTDSPGQLLTALDEFASGPNGAEFATACYAVLDPVTRELRYASAAHPPMLVLTPSGRARWLEDGRSLPLGGAHEGHRPEASTVLDPDALLLLYSDGLVERRRESVSVGLARLERAAKSHLTAPVEDLCDRLITDLGADADRDDDAVVMCVRLVPAGARFQRAFPADAAELAPLRTAVREWAASRNLSDKVGAALLLALGEACANAIEHAYRDRPTGLVEVEIRSDGPDLLVCVRDFGSWRPRPPEEGAARGFGSSIIGKLTRSFTRDTGADGTTVSFRLRTVGGGE